MGRHRRRPARASVAGSSPTAAAVSVATCAAGRARAAQPACRGPVAVATAGRGPPAAATAAGRDPPAAATVGGAADAPPAGGGETVSRGRRRWGLARRRAHGRSWGGAACPRRGRRRIRGGNRPRRPWRGEQGPRRRGGAGGTKRPAGSGMSGGAQGGKCEGGGEGCSPAGGSQRRGAIHGHQRTGPSFCWGGVHSAASTQTRGARRIRKNAVVWRPAGSGSHPVWESTESQW